MPAPRGAGIPLFREKSMRAERKYPPQIGTPRNFFLHLPKMSAILDLLNLILFFMGE